MVVRRLRPAHGCTVRGATKPPVAAPHYSVMMVDRALNTEAGVCCRTPFDLWVAGELRRSYGATLTEPVPEVLLRMIDGYGAGPAPASR